MSKTGFSDPLHPYVGKTITYASLENETLVIGFGAPPSPTSIGSVEPDPTEAITVNKVSEEDLVLT